MTPSSAKNERYSLIYRDIAMENSCVTRSCALGIFILIKGCIARGMESELISSVLQNYSHYGRPVEDFSDPVYVRISFHLTQLMGLEEKHQTFTTFGWLEAFWHDDYLTWRPDDFNGLSQVVLSPELVWLPDFGVANSAKAIYDDQFFKKFRVSVQNNGDVNWIPGGKFVTSCQLDITYYPFDDQECHIDIVNWAYHSLEVELTNSSQTVDLDSYTASGEWDIIRTQVTSQNLYHASDPSMPYPMVRFTIYLKRKSMFYTINIITPCITMSVLAILVFYLPPDSREKVSLGITVLLSFSVFLLLVAENVPKTSKFVPLLGIYLTLVMTMTAMSIVICVAILNVHSRDPRKPVPRWLHHLTYTILSPLVCARDDKIAKDSENLLEMHEISNTRDQECGHDNHATTSAPGDTAPDHVNFLLGEECSARIAKVLEEVLDNVKHMTRRIKEQEESTALKKQWTGVARILDRFCLLMFVLLVFISSVFLLVVYPSAPRDDDL